MSNLSDTHRLLVRERRTRRLLETLLKGKNLELYRAHQSLQVAHDELESRVEARTRRLARLNRDCMAARKQAECANLAKSQFLANISHELRTPLNGVFGMLQFLFKSGLDEFQLSCVQTALSSGDTLLKIISDMLDLASLEAGDLAVEQAPFDLRACAEQAVRNLTESAESKRLRLHIECHPDLPNQVLGDSRRICQVLTYLLDNAIKFTESGDIRLEVRPGRRFHSSDEVCILVHDTGIGIARRHLEQIFMAFSQVDGSAIRKFGGSGLGLPVCRHLVRLMGGQIGVRSEPESGSTFWFTLDLPSEKARSEHRSQPEESVPAHVLLVEEDADIRRIGFKLLTNLGCHVDLAESAESARVQLQGRHFDLVFVATESDSSKGLALARAIRSGAGGILDPQVPLIGMTAESGGQELPDADSVLTDTVGKPLLVGPLRRALRRWTRSRALLPSQAG